MGLVLTTQMISAQVPSYVPINELAGWWSFTGNTNDDSGNMNNATNNGATSIIDRFGNSNTAFSLENLNDNLTVSNTMPTLSNTSITISLWIKFPIQWHQSSLALVKNGVPYSNGFDVAIDQNNEAYGANNYNVVFLVGNYAAATFISNQTELGIWSNIVSTYDGNNVKIYLNGILKATQPFNQNLNSPNGNLIFGSWDNPTTPDINSRQIDDIGIWNRALTQDEITSLYYADNTCSSIVINTGLLSFNPPTFNNSVTIYPNPTNDHITIDCGNLANVTGQTIKIFNTLGQEVFSGAMNTQQYVVPLNTWEGQGVYFVKIYDASNIILNTKKIILQ